MGIPVYGLAGALARVSPLGLGFRPPELLGSREVYRPFSGIDLDVSNGKVEKGAAKKRRAKAMKAAVSYLRVSGRGQVSGDGFPRQREVVEGYARACGMELVGEYRDEAVSGTKDLEEREGLTELMARVQANGVRIVLIERADRLARELMVSEVILRQFRDLGATVIDCSAGQDLTSVDSEADPTRTLIRQVLGAVAEFEKSVLVAKLKAARNRLRAKTGRCEGPKPYGERGNPEEAKVVKRMHKWRQEGLSLSEIARRLNAEGVKSPSGKTIWKAESVKQTVRRPG